MALQQPATFKSVQILYWSMFLGQFLIGMVMMQLMSGEEKTPEAPFDMIIPAAVIFGATASYLIGQQRKGSLPTSGTVEEKLAHYRVSNILKWALVEGGNLLALVLTFLMAGPNYLIWFGLGLIAFVLQRPNRVHFMEEYGIGMGEEFE